MKCSDYSLVINFILSNFDRTMIYCKVLIINVNLTIFRFLFSKIQLKYYLRFNYSLIILIGFLNINSSEEMQIIAVRITKVDRKEMKYGKNGIDILVSNFSNQVLIGKNVIINVNIIDTKSKR